MSRILVFVTVVWTICCLVTSAYPHYKHRNRYSSHGGDYLNYLRRLHRGAGDVSLNFDGKLTCDQGRLLAATQMNGKIYLGCAYLHTTEFYWVGVIKTFDANTLQPVGSSVELELPEDHQMDTLVSSPTKNLLYMITYGPGDSKKWLWTVSFPGVDGLQVNYLGTRPTTLVSLKVIPSGNLVLNEATTITILDPNGKVLSQTKNTIKDQGMIPVDVVQLPSGNFLVAHDRQGAFDISELTPSGQVVRSYSTSASSSSPKLTRIATMDLVDSGSLLLLNRNQDPSAPDTIVQVQTDLTSGKVVASGAGNGVEKNGVCVSYSATTGRLLVTFPFSRPLPVANTFKVNS